MNLPRYVASVPLRTLAHYCLEISHPAWPAPHRRVIQPTAVTVTIDGVATSFPGWNENGPWKGEFPAADDSGRAVRTLSLSDPDNALYAQIDSVREHPLPVTARLWEFLTSDLSTPVLTEVYTLQAAAPGNARLELAAVSLEIGVLNDPFIRHTRMNSPGLRGRAA